MICRLIFRGVERVARMKLWVLSHGDTRDNARVRALAQHLARQLPRVLAARQKQDASRA